MVAENLSWEDFAKVNLHSLDLPGVQLDVGETRDYPHGEAFSHVVGYVGAVSEAELGEDPLLELPGFRIGKSGVEKIYDEKLRGRAGHRSEEHTSELQSLMRISYAVFCLKKKKTETSKRQLN